MTTNQRIIVKQDGREVSLDSLRPTAHSQMLDAAVVRMLRAGSDYRTAVAAETARLNFTPQGRNEMAGAHGRKALAALAVDYKKARQQAVAERASAAEQHANAINSRVKVDATTVPVLIELAKQLKADVRLRGSLVEMVRNDAELEFMHIEYVEAGAVMPLALSGLTMPQKMSFRSFVTPEETAKLTRAMEAEAYVDQLAGTLARSISQDARLLVSAVDPDLFACLGKIERRIAATMPETLRTGSAAEVPATAATVPATNTEVPNTETVAATPAAATAEE